MKTCNLWIVDDDPDDHEFIKEALQSLDVSIQVNFYSLATHALQELENGLIIPDVIISDINMPFMDGLMFLKRIKSLDYMKNVPVIMHSTASGHNTRSNCIESGAYSFVIKSHDFTELMETLKNSLK